MRPGTLLAGWSDDQLTDLLRRRPDLAYPAPPSLAVLAQRAESPGSVVKAVLGLDLPSRQVLEAVCLLGPEASVPAVAEVVDHPLDPALRAVLERLAALALVLLDGSAVHPVSGVFRVVAAPGGLGPPAETLLRTADQAGLQQVAIRLGVEHGGRKAETLRAVAAALADPPTVRAALEAAPEGTSELAELLAHGHPVAPFQSHFGAPYGRQPANDRSPLGWLVNRALLVPRNWSQAVMPAEACLALRGGRVFPGFSLDPPAVASVAVAADVDRSAAEAAERLVADVARLLEALAESPAKLLKAGGLGIREVRRLAKLVDREEAEAARILELAAAAGLVGCDVRKGVAVPTEGWDQWAAADTGARWAALVSGWLTWPREVWVAGADSDAGRPIPPLLPGEWDTGATERRAEVLSVLAGAPRGQAPVLADVVGRLRWRRPGAWDQSPEASPWVVARMGEELALLGLRVTGALSEAGRAVAAGSVEDAVLALEAHGPELVERVHLQADLTGVVPGRLAASVACELDLMADVESQGHATVYRFSEASVRRALEAGRTADQLLGLLEAHASRGVPQALSYLVSDTARRFGRVRVGTAGAYLVCADQALAAQVLAERGLTRLGLRSLAPTVLVCGAGAAEVLAALSRAGYLPAHEGPEGQLVVSRKGALRAPALAPPSFGGPPSRAPGPEAIVAAMRRQPPPPSSRPAGRGRSPVAVPGRAEPARLFAVPPGMARRPGGAGAEPDLDAFDFDTDIGAFGDSDFGDSDFEDSDFEDSDFEDSDFEDSDLEDDDDEVPRPTGIARGVVAVSQLLGRAHHEEWTVRLSYVNARGQDTTLVADVISLSADRVRVICAPSWGERELIVDRIEWARVLTAAEEEALS